MTTDTTGGTSSTLADVRIFPTVPRARIRDLLAPARAGEWWEHKLAPVAGTGYASAVMAGGHLTACVGTIVLTVGALAICATYVSVLNEVTDREVDRLAGKRNRMEGRSPLACALALGVIVAAGAAIAVLAWRGQPALVGLYSGAWLAFTLYSAPGVRFKGRGLGGLICDAAGAHVFPHLLVAVAVLEHLHAGVNPAWMAAIGAWSMGAGLRGALWHQLGDLDADLRAGVRTFARADPGRARNAGRYFAFPLELAGLVAILVLAPGVAAAALLAPYLFLEWRWAARWKLRLVVVTPAVRQRIVMHDYTVAVYPLAFALTAALWHPADAIVLAGHLLVFPHIARRLAADSWHEIRTVVRARLRPSRARFG
jgi:hypothetical protein